MKAFVIYIEHDCGPHCVYPHCVSVHKTMAEAERELREYCRNVFSRNVVFEDDGEEEFPVIETLAEHNEYARIYECGGEEGSIEVEPFENTREAFRKAKAAG